LRVRPRCYKCPDCKCTFTSRKKKCCPGCGTFLRIASDILSDVELTELRSFWMWEPFKKRWEYIRDWDEHKREAIGKLEVNAHGRGAGFVKAEEKPRPLTRWIQ
jgi:hypothetical protein